MAKPRDDDIDIREEMRVALFWRALIGDDRYVQFDPEDMLRWYMALELRGFDEVRTLRNERYATAQTGAMQGLVAKAPHPPVWLVNQWLERQEQEVPHVWRAWTMAGVTVVTIGLVFGNMQGCASLPTMGQLAMNPPQVPKVSTYALPVHTGVGVTRGPPLALGPPTAAGVAAPTVTGPQSNGIAGMASGAVPASGAAAPPGGTSAGVTGPQNIGVSGGAAPVGGTQP